MKLTVAIVFVLSVGQTFCFLDKALNETCESTKDCKIPFSFCNEEKKCQCRTQDGFFLTIGNTCESPIRQCPAVIIAGEAKQGVSTLPCESFFDVHSYLEINSTCPEGQFCYVHVNEFVGGDKENRRLGHCCPIPPPGAVVDLVCPISNAQANHTCKEYTGPADAPAPPDQISTCPFNSHHCIRQPFRAEKICCPSPCSGTNNDIQIGDECFKYAPIDAPCQHTIQCTGWSICLPSPSGGKTCQCKPGTRPLGAPRHCIEQ